MIVVADTSPIDYLSLLGHIEILPKIYGDVLIPQAVFDEQTLLADFPQHSFPKQAIHFRLIAAAL
jgi:predicted nucleic acid-binding protein